MRCILPDNAKVDATKSINNMIKLSVRLMLDKKSCAKCKTAHIGQSLPVQSWSCLICENNETNKNVAIKNTTKAIINNLRLRNICLSPVL